MRKKLLSIMLCVILSSPSFGAFNATMQWGVSTSGATTNSGGYDSGVSAPGTNEVQGVATGTSVTCTFTGTTTGGCVPAISATTHGPGNTILFASGTGCTTTHPFEIISQASGAFTLDSAAASSTDVCVGVLGGELSTIGAANAQWVSGNTINLQGTQTLTGTLNIAATIVNFFIRGYGTTWGDNGTCGTITTATNSTILMSTNSGTAGFQTWQNLCLSNTAGTPADGIVQLTNNNSPETWSFIDVKFSGFTEAVANDDQGANDYVKFTNLSGPLGKCEFANQVNNAIYTYGGSESLTVNGCWFHGLSGTTPIFIRFQPNTGDYSPIIVTHSIFSDVSVAGNFAINADGGQMILDSNIFTNLTGLGSIAVYLPLGINTQTTYRATNNIFYGNTAPYPGTFTTPATGIPTFAALSSNNAYDNPNSGFASTGDVLLTASPFVNESAGNFALNTTSGGGALLRAAGFPGKAAGGATTGYLDIGAVQSQSAAAGGLLVNPGTSGGFRN